MAAAPSGKVASRTEALANFKAAWLTYHDERNWPPGQSAAWMAPGIKDGQGPWRSGEKPRGWKAD